MYRASPKLQSNNKVRGSVQPNITTTQILRYPSACAIAKSHTAIVRVVSQISQISRMTFSVATGTVQHRSLPFLLAHHDTTPDLRYYFELHLALDIIAWGGVRNTTY